MTRLKTELPLNRKISPVKQLMRARRKLNQKNNFMNDLNPSRKLAARPRAGCFLSLFLLAGLPALVTPLRADNPPTFLFQWGSQGSGNGQFGEPTGIAVDSNNNVYVEDSGVANERVEKFDHNGNYLTQWGNYGAGNGQFNAPVGITVDSSNNFYVVDSGNNRIEKFDHNGNYLSQVGSSGTGNGQFNSPEGIAIDIRAYLINAARG